MKKGQKAELAVGEGRHGVHSQTGWGPGTSPHFPAFLSGTGRPRLTELPTKQSRALSNSVSYTDYKRRVSCRASLSGHCPLQRSWLQTLPDAEGHGPSGAASGLRGTCPPWDMLQDRLRPAQLLPCSPVLGASRGLPLGLRFNCGPSLACVACVDTCKGAWVPALPAPTFLPVAPAQDCTICTSGSMNILGAHRLRGKYK